MANHMADVAKMLGVELGEEFECSDGFEYIFTEDGLVCKQLMNYKFKPINLSPFLNDLLTGDLIIKRKPWIPKIQEPYFTVYKDGDVAKNLWSGNTEDICYYKLGNCYRAEAEAEANRDKWVDFYASDEVLEV